MTDFTQLGLSAETLKAIAATGYTVPTPIQEQAIPVALAGRDVLGIAQTGTGKTAAFTLPMIDRLAAGRARARMPRSLVIEPTRELADQVASAFERYATGQKLSWALLIGGVSFEDQVKKLDRGVDVLIATPGRLLDHFERGKLLLTGVQMMVVDEADRMLDMGFIPDIERIFKLTPPVRQTLFFSATMPPEITRLTTQFLKDPTRIEVTRAASVVDTIAQHAAKIPSSDPKAKRTALRALISGAEVKNAIVFCNRKSEVDVVAKSLRTHGFDAAAIHGDLDQSVRTRTLESFRKGELKILVASDVAARGLDIPAVSHVFNYDVPHHADDYVHRIGRTGRAGRQGETFMIVTPADAKNYDKVVKLTKQEPEEVTLDLDWSSLESSDQDRRGGGRREARGRDARGRDGGGRGERSSRERHPRASRAEAASADAPLDAAEPAELSPVAEDAAPGPRSRRRRAPRSAEVEVEVSAVETPPSDAFEADSDEPAAAEPRPFEARASRPRSADASGFGFGSPERDASEMRRSDARRPDTRSRSARPGADREPRGPAVVGFGADTPAFLLRAPPARKASSPEE